MPEIKLYTKDIENIANNQVVFHHERGTAFYSYGTFIGARVGYSELYLSDAHDYSKTTSKWCGRWCGYDLNTRRKMLEDGSAVLVKS